MPPPITDELDTVKQQLAVVNAELTALADLRRRELAAAEKMAADLKAEKDATVKATADELARKHAADKRAAIDELKVSVLMPTLLREHERQKAELLARQQAEIDALKAR